MAASDTAVSDKAVDLAVEGILLRPMRWPDIAVAAALDAQLFATEAWPAETFWAELARPENRSYIVAESAGLVVGYAGVMVAGSTADVQTIVVRPSHQGRGVGRTLLRTLVEHAGERGATEMLLECRADNQAALGLYAIAGFERIARRRGYYGPGEDAVIMRLHPLRAPDTR